MLSTEKWKMLEGKSDDYDVEIDDYQFLTKVSKMLLWDPKVNEYLHNTAF